MHDGRALQGGTSHYFGQNFTKSFDVKFKIEKVNKNMHIKHLGELVLD